MDFRFLSGIFRYCSEAKKSFENKIARKSVFSVGHPICHHDGQFSSVFLRNLCFIRTCSNKKTVFWKICCEDGFHVYHWSCHITIETFFEKLKPKIQSTTRFLYHTTGNQNRFHERKEVISITEKRFKSLYGFIMWQRPEEENILPAWENPVTMAENYIHKLLEAKICSTKIFL